MDKDTAKNMIKKGIEYNDPELIEMGNLILQQFFKEEDVAEKPQVKKRGRPKKQKIIIEETVSDKEDFTAPPRKSIKTEKNDDEKRFTKKRPLNINIKPLTLDEHKSDSEIDKILINNNYKPSYRESFKGYNQLCNSCEKEFNSDIIQSTCPKCLKGKIGNGRKTL